MKRILITGMNSYIGNHVEEWLAEFPNNYDVQKISLRNNVWRSIDFSKFDSILHVSAIVHTKKIKNNRNLFYKVNRDLTYDIAKKAKDDGVKQFIFLSSMNVYGLERGVINHLTPTKPKSHYGISKFQAENQLKTLINSGISIAILRPPMIYGEKSKGNYPKLAKAAQILPVFPNFRNRRSMLHIDNLSEFIRLLIENEENGIFFPQNKEYVNTSKMVHIISLIHNRKIKMVNIFNPILNLTIGKIKIITKIFGSLVYDKNLSAYHTNYQVREFEKSLVISEKER